MSAPVVHSYSPRVVGIGCPVTVSGVGFSAFTTVSDGESDCIVLDFDDDSLTFAAPKNAGNYSVSVKNESESQTAFPLIVVALENVPVRNLEEKTDSDFRDLLLGLMPRGFAWFIGKNGNWWKLFSGFAVTISLVYESLKMLIRESNPLSTTSLDIWENELNLPRKGAVYSDEESRRVEVYRNSRMPGGCTVPSYESIAALFGKNIRIYEYWKNPEKFQTVTFTDDPNFYWKVSLPMSADDMHEHDCNGECDEYLRWWWDDNVESAFEMVKPAHTKVLFSYENQE